MYENNDYSNYEFTQQSAEEKHTYYPYANYSSTQKTQNTKTKNRKSLKTVALVLVCSLLSGCFGAAIVSKKGTSSNGNQVAIVESDRNATIVSVTSQTSDKEMTAAEVYAANVNSTVGITTSVITTNFWGMKTSSPAAGSGFIISKDGYIVTNYHVIEDGSDIKVATYDEKTYDATVVGYDESNDVAVLKIDANDLTPVVIGSSETLHVGDEVIAIGNPLGELTFSLTKGNVSALNREVTLSTNVTMDLIQTDAAINSGNSGGALFNMYGEVVGITNAKYSGSGSFGEASIDNIGFAIPMDNVESIITSIIEKGYVSKPYIGVELSNASDAALVYSVKEGSPAEKAGLKTNDIISEANGEKISSADDLKTLVKKLSVGDELKLIVMRGGSETEITVTIGEKLQEEKKETTEKQNGTQYGNDFFDDFSDYFEFPFSGIGGF